MEESFTKLKLKTIHVLWQTVKNAEATISDKKSEEEKNFKKKKKSSNVRF